MVSERDGRGVSARSEVARSRGERRGEHDDRDFIEARTSARRARAMWAARISRNSFADDGRGPEPCARWPRRGLSRTSRSVVAPPSRNRDVGGDAPGPVAERGRAHDASRRCRRFRDPRAPGRLTRGTSAWWRTLSRLSSRRAHRPSGGRVAGFALNCGVALAFLPPRPRSRPPPSASEPTPSPASSVSTPGSGGRSRRRRGRRVGRAFPRGAAHV